jgi:hypothetical protein
VRYIYVVSRLRVKALLDIQYFTFQFSISLRFRCSPTIVRATFQMKRLRKFHVDVALGKTYYDRYIATGMCLTLSFTDCHSKWGLDRKSSSTQIHGNCGIFFY